MIFNTLTLHEQVDDNRVKNLKGAKIEIVPVDEKKKLEKYRNVWTSSGYRIDYQQPELKAFGRVKEIPFTGLGTFCQSVRGYLARDIYVDVDMVNCHPVILAHEFKARKLDCTDINEYVNNRKEFLEVEGIDKKDFLKMINKEDYQGNSSRVNSIHSQIYDTFVPLILKENPEMAAQVRKSRLVNKNGALVANYLQHREFTLLGELYNFCKANGMIVDVLMHDGFFVRITKEVKKENVEEFLPKFSAHIKEKFNLNMQFKIKEHDLSLVDLIDNNGGSEYVKMKREFELTHCKIINKSLFVKESNDGYQLFTEKSLMVSYKHLCFQKADESISFITTWLKDSEMRLYTDLDCYPKEETCPRDVFNIWKPFRVNKMNVLPSESNEGRDMILNHIKILCGHDEVVYTWFCKWVGHMLIYPEKKTFCPVLISKQGGGKGRLIDFLRQLLGSSKVFECTNPERDVWGQFNGRMKESFLVNINELSKKSTFDAMGRIKGLITDEEITINEKGVAQYTTNSFHRFLITTNSDDPIETSYDDRRFVIIRSSDEKCGDHEYFTRLMEYIQDDSVVMSCYKYFIQLEGLNKFHSEKLPTTKYQDNLRENSLSPVEFWLRDDLCLKEKTGEVRLTNNQVYSRFKNFCDANGIKFEITSIKLGNKIMNLGVPGIENGRTKNDRIKIFDIVKMKSHFKIEDSGYMFIEEPLKADLDSDEEIMVH